MISICLICSKDGDGALLEFLWQGYQDASGLVCWKTLTEILFFEVAVPI